ncbi:hypothetical protein [Pseudomonas sp. 6D_7.1_Bac1]|uniref:hypothetical protein n=1 Tax=Pseudomonas sp. 6D_7.1_Bac1 TaxID=2971615 RepID=UPI0021C6D5D0|nr:hypothetical protein [Pseudomonas sp. 6D_7.1_Bac1]MCU1752117.1 hypothetical protein [Pseudomonas sp. 6D_7.1_Bac1]
MGKLIKFSFFCLGVGWAAWHSVLLLIYLKPASFSLEGAYIKLYPSPGGGSTAALVSYSGGGGLSPYCYDEIVIFNKTMDVQVAIKDREYQVYSAGCASFSDRSNSPKIEWTLDSKVRVEFALGRSSLDARKVVMKGVDKTGSVRVEFYAHQ